MNIVLIGCVCIHLTLLLWNMKIISFWVHLLGNFLPALRIAANCCISSNWNRNHPILARYTVAFHNARSNWAMYHSIFLNMHAFCLNKIIHMTEPRMIELVLVPCRRVADTSAPRIHWCHVKRLQGIVFTEISKRQYSPCKSPCVPSGCTIKKTMNQWFGNSLIATTIVLKDCWMSNKLPLVDDNCTMVEAPQGCRFLAGAARNSNLDPIGDKVCMHLYSTLHTNRQVMCLLRMTPMVATASHVGVEWFTDTPCPSA